MPDTEPLDTRKRLQRTYGDDERAHVLLQLKLLGGNVEATARATGTPASTIRCWRAEDCRAGQRAEAMIQAESGPLSAKFRQVAEEYIAVGLAKKDLLSPYQAIIGACAATDKALVLEGAPNVIHATHQQSALDLLSIEQRLQLRAWLRAEQAAKAAPVTIDAMPALPASLETAHE